MSETAPPQAAARQAGPEQTSHPLAGLSVTVTAALDSTDVTLVLVDGPLTARTCAGLREPLRALHERGHARVRVDLSGVVRIDPAGFGVLVGALRRAELAGDGRTLTFVDRTDTVRSKARLTGLARLLGLARTPDAARGAGLAA